MLSLPSTGRSLRFSYQYYTSWLATLAFNRGRSGSVLLSNRIDQIMIMHDSSSTSITILLHFMQACYDVVHKTVIELCGTHMECLFKVYDDTAIPADMKDIKNEKCRCYIKLVSAFEMNHDKKCTLEDLKVSIFVATVQWNPSLLSFIARCP